MSKDSGYDYEETMVTLTDEDGNDRDFYIDEIYEVNGTLYAAAIPGDEENVTEYYVFRLIDLGNDDYVIGMEPIISNDVCLLAITENGFGKRTEVEEYRVQTRGGKGVLTYKVTDKTGEVVGIKVVKETDDIILISSDGTIIRLAVKDVSVLGRNTQGVTLMRMPEGVQLVSIAKVTDEEEEIEEN